MRGLDETSWALSSYVDLEERIPPRHPLRKIRQVVNEMLASPDTEFDALYTDYDAALAKFTSNFLRAFQ